MSDNADPPATMEPPAPSTKTRAGIQDAIVSLLEGAQHDVAIFGAALDGYYFNNQRVAEAIGHLIARHHSNRVYILTEDSQQFSRDNPRMLALARRFGDAIELRRVGENHTGLRELFVLADSHTVLHLPDFEQPATGPSPQPGPLLARRFRAMWEAGEPLPGINPAGL